MGAKPNVLILCTGNSCRSQMAEGLLRHYGGDRFNVYSAGTDPREEVHPLAIQVMAEIGIDLSQQQPKSLDQYLGRLAVQHLIIVCDGANASCPTVWPLMQQRHYWPFDDPAQFYGVEDEKLREFRRVRNEIRRRLLDWLPTA
jgi:arsenate reductase